MLHCQLLSYEAAQALQILAVQFNVVVSRSLHPERLHGFGAALEQSQAVREVNHLVLCPVDDEHRGRDFGHFLNAESGKGGMRKEKKSDFKEMYDLSILVEYITTKWPNLKIITKPWNIDAEIYVGNSRERYRQIHMENGGMPAAHSEFEQQASTGGFLSSLHSQQGIPWFPTTSAPHPLAPSGTRLCVKAGVRCY